MSQSNSTYIESHLLKRLTILKKVGSGAYGHVWKVEQKSTKRIFALKKIFDAFQHATDAQRTYRQIQILKQLEHPNIIKLHETIRADNNKDVYLLFEYMEADLHNVISEGILKDVHIRFIIYQLAKSLKYLHSGSIIHRDLKPSNILVNSNCTIKLCDFGLVRSLLPTSQAVAVLTEGVATRWYRAPEVLLGSKSYSNPADIWSFGCIIYQILAQKPLFPGNSTLDQIQKICNFTGYPTEQDIESLESQVSKSMMKEIKSSTTAKSSTFLKDFSPHFIDLLERIIVFNPSKRLTIEEILSHQIVKAFHKPEEQIVCKKTISTSIDDNKKLTVDEYRKRIYGISSNSKPKALSSSVGSNSAKYLPMHNKTTIVSTSTHTPSSHSSNKTQIQKPQLSKKYSHEKLRTNTMHTTTYSKVVQEPFDPKKYQKPALKYVRSNKDISKNDSFSQNACKKHVDSSYSKIESQLKKEQKQPGGKSYEVKKQSHSSYLSSHNSGKLYGDRDRANKQSLHGVSSPTVGAWKALRSGLTTNNIVSPKQLKDNSSFFKSPKYISINKSQTLNKTNHSQKT